MIADNQGVIMGRLPAGGRKGESMAYNKAKRAALAEERDGLLAAVRVAAENLTSRNESWGAGGSVHRRLARAREAVREAEDLVRKIQQFEAELAEAVDGALKRGCDRILVMREIMEGQAHGYEFRRQDRESRLRAEKRNTGR